MKSESSREQTLERLQAKIKTLNESTWSRNANWTVVQAWLDQFSSSKDPSSDEQLQVLFLLSHFMYFGLFEIRALVRSLYRDHFRYKIIEKIREQKSDTTDLSKILPDLESSLSKTRFISVGNPSESSSHLLYYFRQENRLPKHMFAGQLDLFRFVDREGVVEVDLIDDAIENYVFIDDLCGSGAQISEYSRRIVPAIRRLAPNARVFYYALFGNISGLEVVRSLDRFDVVEAVVELDETFKAFSDVSRIFIDEQLPIDRSFARTICDSHGQKLLPGAPLGFEDNQLLLGFSHNTPDNTLPIMWYDDPYGAPWVPVFRRYPK